MKQTIWKKITIGGKKKYVFDKEIYVSSRGKDLQEKTSLAKKKEILDLVILTPKDLGFTKYPTTTELFDEKNLTKYGIELCPAEVGLALREQYTDQPNQEWLYVAMKPIIASDGSPSVWCVERCDGGELFLRGSWANPYDAWGLDYPIVFRLRKSLGNSEPQSSSDTKSSKLSAESSDEASSLESAITRVKEAGYTIFKEI